MGMAIDMSIGMDMPVMLHRHRLGNQRADEDHPHGEQAQPAATDAPAIRAGAAG
jgi:hypothetical protein